MLELMVVKHIATGVRRILFPSTADGEHHFQYSGVISQQLAHLSSKSSAVVCSSCLPRILG